MRLDLHVHSTASDGTCTPENVVSRAIAGSLDVIALSDHDTVAGVGSALRAAQGERLHIIPAAELSASVLGHEVHILAYFIDHRSEALAGYQERSRQGRAERMREILRRLASQGVVIDWDELIASSSPQESNPLTDTSLAAGVSLTRAHLGRALVKQGFVAKIDDAFTELIGNHCPAYVPAATPIEEVMGVIESAGGVAVWAHPPPREFALLLPPLLDAGLRGLEVLRAPGRQGNVAELEAASQEWGLLVTGGSDWHGPEGGSELGDFFITAEDAADFLVVGGL